jgi:hypothetical protein
MTLAVETLRVVYADTGTGPFAVPFAYSADSEVVVTKQSAAGTITTLALNTDYTLSAVTGVTLVTAQATGDKLSVHRAQSIAQNTDIAVNDPFRSTVIEDALDVARKIDGELAERVARAMMFPPTDSTSLAYQLPAAALRANKVMYFDADGEPSVIDPDDLPELINGTPGETTYIPQTTTEAALGITPSNYLYQPGDFRRYGADPTGVADSATAITNACKTGQAFGGGPYTYKVTSDVVISTSLVIDGQGCTLKPTGTTRCLHRNNVSLEANTTISSGATKGSRTLVVASATGIAVGQWCFFYADDAPTHAAFSYPPSWAKITNVAGTTITIDRALRVTYGGTINFRCYATTTLLDRFHVRNLTIDGSASTSAQVGDGIRVNGYREILIEGCTFKDWTYNNNSVGVVKIFQSLDARVINNRWIGQNNGGEGSSIDDCLSGLYQGNTVDGNHFGLTMIRVDHPRFIGNALTGQLSENLDAGTAKSIRGLKAYGCYFPIATGNHIHDYESAFKWEQSFGGIISNNVVSGRPNATGYTGQIAINVSASPGTGTNQRDTIISNNIVDGVVGSGIGVGNDPPGVVIISGNIIKNCGAIGIYTAVSNVTIVNNQIENWGLRNSADQAVYHGGLGATIRGNRFRHSTLTGLSCIRNLFGTGYVFDIGDNSVETANPMGVTMEATGTATINSGSTSVTITHGLTRTPSAAEITWRFTATTTNDFGTTWISNITSTQFTINVRSDPGASNLAISWRAFKTNPFTA